MACKRCGYSGSGSPCPVCWPNNVTPVTKVRYETPSVTKLVPTPEERAETRRVVEEIRRGRPRVHKTNAERQRAYRERRNV
jgi:hypothetical protein